jgi:hypothetical protein
MLCMLRLPKYSVVFSIFFTADMSTMLRLPQYSMVFGVYFRIDDVLLVSFADCLSISPVQVRSFIKGSVEAAWAGRPLSRAEYLQLAPQRCRLSAAQREQAYSVYIAYQVGS